MLRGRGSFLPRMPLRSRTFRVPSPSPSGTSGPSHRERRDHGAPRSDHSGSLRPYAFAEICDVHRRLHELDGSVRSRSFLRRGTSARRSDSRRRVCSRMSAPSRGHHERTDSAPRANPARTGRGSQRCEPYLKNSRRLFRKQSMSARSGVRKDWSSKSIRLASWQSRLGCAWKSPSAWTFSSA